MKVLTSSKVAQPIRRKFANVEAFEKWAFQQEFGYEFVNGKAVKKNMIKYMEYFILRKLMRLFLLTKAHAENSELLTETMIKLPNDKIRVPDMAYFTDAQIIEASEDGSPIPEFVIEFLSKNDTLEEIEEKINDYFSSGVKVVWYINLKAQTIHHYTSAKSIHISSGDDIVSASPVVPDYTFPAKEIFKKELALS
jgi:Uma2 family endonuclease